MIDIEPSHTELLAWAGMVEKGWHWRLKTEDISRMISFLSSVKRERDSALRQLEDVSEERDAAIRHLQQATEDHRQTNNRLMSMKAVLREWDFLREALIAREYEPGSLAVTKLLDETSRVLAP